MLTVVEAQPVAAAINGLTTAQASFIVAGVSLLNILLGAALGRRAETTNQRRTQYAAAVTTLFAWAEYPYRIRRRISDDAVELGRLRDLGNDLQERLRSHQTWITTESATVAKSYRQTWKLVASSAGPAAHDAWTHPPRVGAASMNLDGWGPDDPGHHIELLQQVIGTRFGYRRLIPWLAQRRARHISGFAETVSA